MRANILDTKPAPAARFIVGVVGNLLVVLLCAGVTGCHGHGKSEKPPAAEVSSVNVVTPVKQAIKRTILQPGFAKPYEQTPIYSRVPGYVGDVPGNKDQEDKHIADIGDEVKKGNPLATLWVPELEKDFKSKEARVGQAEAQVKQADATYEAAKANVETTKANVLEAHAAIARGEAEVKRWTAELDRGKRLSTGLVYDKQTLDEVTYQKEAASAGWEQAKAKYLSTKASVLESEARRDKAKADIDAAKESLLVAKADRDQSKVWLDYRVIRAPYDCVVTQRNVHTGHFLQASSSGSTNKSAEPLFNVVRMDILRINVQVPEYDAALVKDGDEAILTFQGLKDEAIVGKVTRNTDVLDMEARTLRVEIWLHNTRLPNGNWKLRPGMYVNSTINVVTPKVWTLPKDAIFTDGEKSYCFLVDQESGKALKTAIQVGVRNDTLVEVMKKQARSEQAKDQAWEDFTGLEQIVAANPESLIDGQAVSVAAPKNAPPGGK
jgi:HlyD family secretion protein